MKSKIINEVIPVNRIREARKAKSLIMKELAQKIGVTESTISMYETGKREPDLETLVRIADVLDVSTDYLLGRSASPSSIDAQTFSYPVVLPNRIKQCRERANLSQKYVAHVLGVAAPSVSNWESGKTKPTMKNFIGLAKLFDVPVEYIANVSEESTASVESSVLDPRLVDLLTDLTSLEREKAISYIEGLKSRRE